MMGYYEDLSQKIIKEFEDRRKTCTHEKRVESFYYRSSDGRIIRCLECSICGQVFNWGGHY